MSLTDLGKDELVHIIEMLSADKVQITHRIDMAGCLDCTPWSPCGDCTDSVFIYVRVTVRGLTTNICVMGEECHDPQATTIPSYFVIHCNECGDSQTTITGSIRSAIVDIIHSVPNWEMYEWTTSE